MPANTTRSCTRALGRFADLLHALLTNPGILIRLDNETSTATNPNENLGRELLELYTVGVGHYTEGDVRQSALLLTGHGVDNATMIYRFNPADHHVGALQIMDFKTNNGTAAGGPEALKAYLTYLARHEGTAEHLARRFAVRFISDDPAQATVDELAKVYLDNDTNLKALVRATLTHPDFAASAGSKWRRPMEFLPTISRASKISTFDPPGKFVPGRSGDLIKIGLWGNLIQSGQHVPRRWPDVDGYPDIADYWNSAAATMAMWNAAQDAVLGDETESGLTKWSAVLGIKGGDNAMATAKRITWDLTGWEFPDDDINRVAALLASGGSSAADVTSVVHPQNFESCISQAVRVTFASPFGFLR
ncbi:MAG: DUF1800 family protein [Nostocoides sp.]